MTLRAYTLWFIFAALITSCASEPEVDENTPDGLFTIAEYYQKNDRYEEAIQKYKSLSNKFPYSKLAIEAELKVADCHYQREEFIEAGAAYKTFKELHPRHPRIDYVTFSAAESLRQQLPSTVDKDLSQAKPAINLYEEILTLYPGSEYAAASKENRLKLIQMLADKEIYIADFYYKQKKYISALTRLEHFTESFSNNQRMPYVLLQAARSAERAEVPDKVGRFVGLLVSHYPDTKEAKQARREFKNAAR